MLRTPLLLSLSTLLLMSVVTRGDDNPWTAAPDPNAAPVPKWIWGKDEAKNDQTLDFRAEFDPKMPPKPMTEDPSSALLWAVGDDDMSVFINGRLALRASRQTGTGGAMADVRALLQPGINVINARVRNHEGPAGVALKLVVR